MRLDIFGDQSDAFLILHNFSTFFSFVILHAVIVAKRSQIFKHDLSFVYSLPLYTKIVHLKGKHIIKFQYSFYLFQNSSTLNSNVEILVLFLTICFQPII